MHAISVTDVAARYRYGLSEGARLRRYNVTKERRKRREIITFQNGFPPQAAEMNMQKQYWSYMYQIRFAIFYLDLYADRAYKINHAIRTISAIASSGCIAAWAVWQELKYVWAIVIALSQVINAIKDFLPYSARLKNIEAGQKSLKLLYSKIEYNWFFVQNGELSEKQINELLYEFKREYTEIESHCLKEDVSLKNRRRREKAQKQTGSYFQTFL